MQELTTPAHYDTLFCMPACPLEAPESGAAGRFLRKKAL